jgi:hypothetical protein
VIAFAIDKLDHPQLLSFLELVNGLSLVNKLVCCYKVRSDDSQCPNHSSALIGDHVLYERSERVKYRFLNVPCCWRGSRDTDEVDGYQCSHSTRRSSSVLLMLRLRLRHNSFEVCLLARLDLKPVCDLVLNVACVDVICRYVCRSRSMKAAEGQRCGEQTIVLLGIDTRLAPVNILKGRCCAGALR